MDVEVRLSLAAVSEDPEARRVRGELPAEVDDVAVGVPLAENRDEPEDEPLDAERFRVRGHESLCGHLRGRVERSLDREGSVFGRREDRRLSVDRARGREDDPPGPGGAHRVEDVGGADRVLLEVAPRVEGAEAHVRVRGQVEDDFGAGHRPLESARVEDISFHEGEAPGRERALEELLAPRREVVVARHVVARREEVVDERAADEAGRTGHERLHRAPDLRIRMSSPRSARLPDTRSNRLSPSSRQRIGTWRIFRPRSRAWTRSSTSNM